MIDRLFDFVLDHLVLTTIAFLAIVAAFVFALFQAEKRAQVECLERGGSWQHTGDTIIYQKIGDIIVPQTIPTYSCVGGKGEDHDG